MRKIKRELRFWVFVKLMAWAQMVVPNDCLDTKIGIALLANNNELK